MRSRHIQFGSSTVLAAAACVVTIFAQGTSAPPVKIADQLVTVTAKVESIDLAKREVTLKGPLGNVETVVVSDQVQRLNEVKVGDEVTAKYYIGIAAELREPTAAEKAEPYKVIEGSGRAPATSAPAGAIVHAIRIVATVEALDRTTQTVTLKGPGGRYVTVRVADPKILEKPRLGDTVVVTAAEAVAVSLEKAKGGSE